jgi:hypothetical protein
LGGLEKYLTRRREKINMKKMRREIKKRETFLFLCGLYLHLNFKRREYVDFNLIRKYRG